MRENGPLFSVLQQNFHPAGHAFFHGHPEFRRDTAASIGMPYRLHPQIFHMHPGLCIQAHVAEDPEKAEEILVFQKCRGTPFVDFHRKKISFRLQIRSQIEFRRREAVFCITHKGAVQPHIHGLLHAFQPDKYLLSLKSFFQVKFPSVRTHRIIFCLTEHAPSPVILSQAVSRPPVNLSLPGIHGIDIMDPVIARQFDMTGNLNPVKIRRVIIHTEEIRRTAHGIWGIPKLPVPVQRLDQRVLS